MAVVRRALCVLGVLVAAVAASGWGWGSARAQAWKLINLDELARHEFHGYVGIQPLPLGTLTKDGAVYWTAHQWDLDGKTLEVFRWRNGVIADLGSPGPNLTVWAVDDREQFLVGTTPVEQPFCPPPPSGKPPCQGVPQPPLHNYLWEQGTLTDLGSLGGTDTNVSAINDSGQIVGSSAIGKGARAPLHAFLWEQGAMIDLGTLGGRSSRATAINDHGQVFGTSQTTDGAVHGFIWEHGKMTDVGTQPAAIFKQPVAMNERGQVIAVIGYPGHTYLWQNGKTIRLGSLDLRGYPLVCRGVRRTSCPPRCPGPKCGRWGSVATAIDDRGEVVGISRTNMDVGRAFLWRNRKITDLGTLGGRSSEALAINNLGMVVGWSDTRLVPWRSPFQAPGTRPFLWQRGRMVKLPVDYGSPTRATAITPSGTEILGDGGWPGHRVLLWLRR